MDFSEVVGLKGLYFDGNIGIDKNLTSIEKNCVLSEELGHHHTSYGDTLDQNAISTIKQEYRARIYGYNLAIGLDGIIQCFEYGCRNRYEMAEYLNVTEQFLEDALEKYHYKYGSYTIYGKYIIYFEPNLTVLKMK